MSDPVSETNGQQRVVINQVTVVLELSTVYQIRQLLVDAIGNAEELLNTHDKELGRTTKKNEITAQMYEAEISNTRNMVALLNQW